MPASNDNGSYPEQYLSRGNSEEWSEMPLNKNDI